MGEQSRGTIVGVRIWAVVLGLALGGDLTSPPWEGTRVTDWDGIIARLIWVESRGDQTRQNPEEGSVGLMQLTPPAVEDFNLKTGERVTMPGLLDPHENRRVGTYYLTNILLTYFGSNLVQAVGAYNVGPTRIARGIYPEAYLEQIVPGAWAAWVARYPVVARWPCSRSGASLVRLAGPDGLPPPVKR